jgi:tetratricopeptide (TPR) repeat protein
MPKNPLDAQTWTVLNRLLDEALEQPPGDLGRWVNELPAEYAELEPRLRALLSHAARMESGDFLQTLPKLELAPGDLAAAGNVEKAGDVIGNYRLLRELGSGGMGVVWLAERIDGLINRPVALKFPHGAWKRAGLAERMAQEREILASLTHPNIAHLYDAGLTAEGQPYLAIEFVEGLPFDVYSRALDLEARLRLFVQVAQAVAYAHGKLVVHRDLKPANILVNSEGQARLLDFGIAKLLDDGTARETRLTAASGRALTPDYASPEQIVGEPLTVASDVYSLGVILYELLSGSRPYKLQRDSRGALEEAIVQTEPPLPSSVAEPAHRKALRGDLDTVVLKALKKHPSERYLTVYALLDDIQRFLSARPVLAQPDSRWYRVRKFLHRNLLAVSAAGAILLAIVIGAGIATWQARVALAEQRRADEVKEFIANIFREASPYNGGNTGALTAIDLLKQAEARLAPSFTDQPAVRVELATLIAESLAALGDIDAAEPILNRTAAEAQRNLGPTHEMTIRVELLQAQMHRMRGRAKEARALLDHILPTMRADPDTKPIDLAGALAHRTLIAMEEAAYPEAEAFAAESAHIANTRLAKDDEQIITSSILLALAYGYTHKFTQSRDAARDAYLAAVARFGTDTPHPRVIEAKGTYGRALANTGELADGLALIDGAVADLRTLTGPDSQQLGMFVQNLVAYRIDLGELKLAEQNSAEALRILTAQVQKESLTYAATLSSRAQVRLARRDLAAALIEFNEAIPILERLVGPEGEFPLLARACRAQTLAFLGRHPEARKEIESVSVIVAKKPEFEFVNARVAQVRGTVMRLDGDARGALQVEEALLANRSQAPKVQRERMRALAESGQALLALGEQARAADALERALAEFTRLEAQVTPARAETLEALGRARLAQHRAADALKPLQAAHDFWLSFDPGNAAAAGAAATLQRAERMLAATP